MPGETDDLVERVRARRAQQAATTTAVGEPPDDGLVRRVQEHRAAQRATVETPARAVEPAGRPTAPGRPPQTLRGLRGLTEAAVTRWHAEADARAAERRAADALGVTPKVYKLWSELNEAGIRAPAVRVAEQPRIFEAALHRRRVQSLVEEYPRLMRALAGVPEGVSLERHWMNLRHDAVDAGDIPLMTHYPPMWRLETDAERLAWTLENAPGLLGLTPEAASDYQSLQALAELAELRRRGNWWQRTGQDFVDLFAGGQPFRPGDVAGATLDGSVDMLFGGLRSLIEFYDELGGGDVVRAQKTTGPFGADPHGGQRGFWETIGALAGYIEEESEYYLRPVPQRQTVWTDLGSAMGQVAGAVAVTAASGGSAAPSTALFMGLGVDQQRQRLRALGLEPRNHLLELGAGGVITAATERVRLGRIMRRLPASTRSRAVGGALKRIGREVLEEGLQEMGEGVLQDLLTRATYNPEHQIRAANILYEGFIGASAGGLFAALVEVVAPGRQRVVRSTEMTADLEAARRSLENAPAISAAPEGAQAALDRVMEGAAVYLDAAAVSALLQEDAQFVETLTALGVTEQDLANVEDGIDLQVAASALLAAPDAPSFRRMLEIARPSRDGVSPAERAAPDLMASQLDADAADVAFEVDQELLEHDLAAELENEHRALLLEAGVAPAEAEANAALWGAFAATLAAPDGFDMDPEGVRGALDGTSLSVVLDLEDSGQRDGADGVVRGETFVAPDANVTEANWRDPSASPVIRLTAARNLSTLAHESAHVYLAILQGLAQSDLATSSADFQEHWSRILDYLGVQEGDFLAGATREGMSPEQQERARERWVQQQEQWARQFEAYLRTGEAPSVALKRVFARFRAWLLRIYNALQGRDMLPNLDQEAQDIFDRMLATDSQLQEARGALAAQRSAVMAQVMTPVERREYDHATQEAADRAFEKQLARQLRDLERQRSAEYMRAEREATEMAREEVLSDPLLALIDELAQQGGVKLDRQALVEIAGLGVLEQLPRGESVIFASAFDASDAGELAPTTEEVALRQELAELVEQRRALEQSDVAVEPDLRSKSAESLRAEFNSRMWTRKDLMALIGGRGLTKKRKAELAELAIAAVRSGTAQTHVRTVTPEHVTEQIKQVERQIKAAESPRMQRARELGFDVDRVLYVRVDSQGNPDPEQLPRGFGDLIGAHYEPHTVLQREGEAWVEPQVAIIPIVVRGRLATQAQWDEALDREVGAFREQFEGDGVETRFELDAGVTASSDFTLRVGDAQQRLGRDYTVEIASDDVATVVFRQPPAVGAPVRVRHKAALDEQFEFEKMGPEGVVTTTPTRYDPRYQEYRIRRAEADERARQALIDEGYAGYEGDTRVLMFDARDTRSVFAQFDPARSDSRELLAQQAEGETLEISARGSDQNNIPLDALPHDVAQAVAAYLDEGATTAPLFEVIEAVKATTASTLRVTDVDSAGRRTTLTFATNDYAVAVQPFPTPPPHFYSAALDAALQLPDRAMTPREAINRIRKGRGSPRWAGRVSREVAYLGLEVAFGGQERVTREQLVEYIKARALVVARVAAETRADGTPTGGLQRRSPSRWDLPPPAPGADPDYAFGDVSLALPKSHDGPRPVAHHSRVVGELVQMFYSTRDTSAGRAIFVSQLQSDNLQAGSPHRATDAVDLPFSQTSEWVALGLSAMVDMAARRGMNAVALPTGTTSAVIQGNDTASQHYDGTVRSRLSALAHALGVTVETGTVTDGNGVQHSAYILVLTPEARSRVTATGLPLFQMAGTAAYDRLRRDDQVPSDLQPLSAAKELADQGRSPRDIWAATGWYRGADGQWRFEIDDSAAAFTDRVTTDKRGRVRASSTKLEELYDHPVLFAAYPQARRTRVIFHRNMGAQSGYFNPLLNVIGLDASKGIEVALSSLTHEVQHLIQEVEGFSPAPDQNQLQAGNYAVAHVRLFWAVNKAIRDAPDMAAANRLRRVRGSMLRTVQSLALRDRTKWALYWTSMGEAEARQAQGRRNLTSAERRALFPDDSLDIPPEQVVDLSRHFALDAEQAIDALGAAGDTFSNIPPLHQEGDGDPGGTVPPTRVVHPDDLAAQLGYADGAELVAALRASPHPRVLIDELVRQKLNEKFGDDLDGSLEAAAVAAVLNERHTQLLKVERDAIARKAMKTPTPVSEIRAYAKERIATSRIKDVARPGMYATHMRAHHRKSIAAAARGDWDTALRESNWAILNAEMARLSVKATTTVGKLDRKVRLAAKRVRSFKRSAKTISPEFIEATQLYLSLLYGNESAPMALAHFVAEQAEAGITVPLPAEATSPGGFSHREDMTLEELQSFVEGLDALYHVGREQSDEAKAQRQARREELAAEIRENSKGVKPRLDRAATAMGRSTRRAAQNARDVDASILRLSFIIEALQGSKRGRVIDAFVTDLEIAVSRKEEAVEGLNNAMRDILRLAGIDHGTLTRGVSEPMLSGLGHITFETIFMLALNTGNEGNLSRVLADPRINPDGNLTEADIIDLLDRHLSARHWAAVQDTWDLINSKWPELEALERRSYGVTPAKVEAREVVTRSGTYRGGYFPVAYDLDESANRDIRERQQDDAFQSFQNGGAARRSTRTGAAIERAQNVSRPLDLSLRVVERHFAEVSQDIHMREVINRIYADLQSAPISDAVIETLGPEYLRAIKTIVQREVAPTMPTHPLTRLMRRLRQNASVAILGYSARTAASVVTSLPETVLPRFGPKVVLRGLAELARLRTDAIGFIYERSVFMRERTKTIVRESYEAAQSRGASTYAPSTSTALRDTLGGLSMALIAGVELVVGAPTWLGVYATEVEAGRTEQQAVAAADRAIAETQGSGRMMDQSLLQSGSETEKYLSFMWGYMSGWYANARNRVAERTTIAGKLAALGQFVILPAVAGALVYVYFRPDDSEDDDAYAYPKRVAKTAADSIIGLVPGVSAITSPWGGRNPSLSGLNRAATAGTGVWDATVSSAFLQGHVDGERAAKQAGNMAVGVGIALGVPGTVQAKRSLTALIEELEQEDLGPEDIWEILITGPDGEGR